MGLFKGDKKRSGHTAAGATPAGSASGAPRAAMSNRGSGTPPSVGEATTFTGTIVAEEDIDVLGTVEGSIQLDQHHLTVGATGVVKADVEANSVLVIGRVTGSVSATDVIEIRDGGYISGDVTAPRIIMTDGAIVIGALDMKAALPKDPVDKEPPKREAPTTVGELYGTDSKKKEEKKDAARRKAKLAERKQAARGDEALERIANLKQTLDS